MSSKNMKCTAMTVSAWLRQRGSISTRLVSSQQICAKEGFFLYLAKLESSTEREVEAQCELKKLLDFRDRGSLESAFAEKEEIIHDDVFEDRGADDNNYEEVSESDYDY